MNLNFRVLAILAIGLPLMMGGMNFSIINIAMAVFQKQFNATISELQWLLNLFGIFISAFMVTMGRIADIYGRRCLYMIGICILGTASLISGFAPRIGWIMGAQALQGLAGSIIFPISQVLLIHLYPLQKKAYAIGMWATMVGVALGIGPLVGGVIIDTLGWPWIFFINIPLVFLSLLFLVLYVNESKNVKQAQKVNFYELSLLALSIGSLVLLIMQSSKWSWISLLFLFVFFLLFLSLFIRLERKISIPIIRPDFFYTRTFLLSSLINFCVIFFAWAGFFLLPLYFQKIQDLTPMQTGLVMLLVTSPTAFFSSLIGKLYHRLSPKILMISGCSMLFFSALCQSFFSSSLLSPLLAALFFGLGMVMAWGPSITSAISSVPHKAAGIASGAFITIQEIGGTLGLTIVGTLFRIGDTFAAGYITSSIALLGISTLGILCSAALKGK